LPFKRSFILGRRLSKREVKIVKMKFLFVRGGESQWEVVLIGSFIEFSN